MNFFVYLCATNLEKYIIVDDSIIIKKLKILINKEK
jgi:hypothetical protein